jgi:hypothetical protein
MGSISVFQKYLVRMLFLVFVINLIGLWAVNYVSIKRLAKLEAESARLAQVSEELAAVSTLMASPVVSSPLPTPSPATISNSSPDLTTQIAIGDLETEQSALTVLIEQLQTKLTSITSRLSTLENDISGIGGAVTDLANNNAASTQAPATPTQSIITASPPLKEQTVYIGAGSSSSTSWTDINAAVIELNSANYSTVERVIFEATVSIVGGEASVRLKNKTSGGIIQESTVIHNNSSPTQKLSKSFSLNGGSNEYIVQLRSSSNEKVILDGARLRLFYR